MIQLAARLYPQQLLERDDRGRTPLILAIQHAGSADVVNAVLREKPQAASIPDGRFPLCLVVETEKYSYHDTLGRLFAAEPPAVTTRDPITRRFPFAVSAL